MRFLGQALHISLGDRPEVQLVTDAQPKFNKAHPQPETLTFVPYTVQVSPKEEGLDQPVSAAPRYLQPVADLREGQAAGLLEQQLEEIQNP